jgi:hypothetical protein
MCQLRFGLMLPWPWMGKFVLYFCLRLKACSEIREGANIPLLEILVELLQKGK